ASAALRPGVGEQRRRGHGRGCGGHHRALQEFAAAEIAHGILRAYTFSGMTYGFRYSRVRSLLPSSSPANFSVFVSIDTTLPMRYSSFSTSTWFSLRCATSRSPASWAA